MPYKKTMRAVAIPQQVYDRMSAIAAREAEKQSRFVSVSSVFTTAALAYLEGKDATEGHVGAPAVEMKHCICTHERKILTNWQGTCSTCRLPTTEGVYSEPLSPAVNSPENQTIVDEIRAELSI